MLELLGDAGAARLAFIAAATVVGSVISGMSGMAGGMLIAVAIAPVVGMKPLVPIITIAMFINHVFRVWVFRHDVDWRKARNVLVTAVPAALGGALLYVSLSPSMVAVVMGVFLLVIVPARRWLQRGVWHVGPRGLAVAGGVYGLVSGTTIGGGMLIVPALLGSGLSGAAFVGTDAVIGITIHLTKLAAFGSLSLLTPDLVAVAVTIGACTVPGTYLARWIISRTSVVLHVLVVEILLVAGGVSFLWRAATGS